jgi:ribosomal protein L29
MARNKTDLKEMDLGELIDELRATKQEALNLRFRNATGQLDNTPRSSGFAADRGASHPHPVSARSLAAESTS